jgi:nitroreductase
MVTNETLKIIKQRRSIRSYQAEQIQDEELQAVLEAGLYAPNAGGQAWHFTVVQNKALLGRLNLAAKESARQMGMEHLKALGNNEKFDCLYGAPTLIIVSGNERSPVPLDADCAAAVENMLIAAESLGIGSCWIFFVLMAFMSSQGDELRKELKIPEGYRPYDAAVFGYGNGLAPKAEDRKSDLITYIG